MTDTTQATSQVITTTDRTLKAIIAATATLSKTAADLQSLAVTSETLAGDIAQKESQLKDIDRQIEVDFRTAKANLALRVLEDERTTTKVLMGKFNFAEITTDELTKLVGDLSVAKGDNSEAVASAVAAAVKEANASWAAKLAGVENAHRVETATLKANEAALIERNTFLSGEIVTLRKQIDDERTTRVEIAKADAARQGVVVNAGKQ